MELNTILLIIVGVFIALFLLDLFLTGGSMTTLAPALREAQVQAWARCTAWR